LGPPDVTIARGKRVVLQTIHLGRRRNAWRTGGQPRLAVASFVPQPCDTEDFGNAAALGRQRIVLQLLVEVFGGEAAGTWLSRRIVAQAAALQVVLEAPTEAQVRASLDALLKSGAGTLEKLDEGDVIARITSTGVALAYD
jgi:hypothetical protein